MKKWLLIILILLIALACGITAANLWDYIKEIIELGISYLFDLAKTIVDALASNIKETAEGVSATSTSLMIRSFIGK